MKDGKYKVIRLTTTRNNVNAFAIGTLYPGDYFEVLHVPDKGKYKDSWAWGYAKGRGFRGWCWIPLFDKRKQEKLAGSPFAPATHRWSKAHGGKIDERTFARHINKHPPDDGAKTHIELPPGKVRTRLRGNKKSPASYDIVYLNNNEPVKWRYITHGPSKDAFVMVRTMTAVPRWGFVRRICLPPDSKLPAF